MPPRYSRPRLIDSQDKQYRTFLEQIQLSRQNHKAIRPPKARDLFGGEAEQALREWLAARIDLSEKRIVEYLEHRSRQAIRKYRELDAVHIPDPKTIHVFEIKASQKASSLRRARQQLGDTRSILKQLFHYVYTTILLVDTGIPKNAAEAAEQAALLAAKFPERDAHTPPPTLAEVIATAPTLRLIDSLDQACEDPESIGILCFNVEQIIELAGAENLHLDWDTEEEEEEAIEPELERYSFSSTGEPTDDQRDDDDDNPMAAALRKALKG
ncbi:MAG: hypothetical protein Fur005_11490 [Roseiflexaceae bacterium]